MNVDVILAAHGAGSGSVANATLESLARRLEGANAGMRVTAAFRLGEPTHRTAIEHADRPTCVVVPILTSDGYYAAALRRDVDRWSRARRPIVLPPIGAEPALAEALSRGVENIVRDRAFARERTQVVVVGHGTVRNPNSRAATGSVASDIGERTGLTAHAAFLDDEPNIEVVIAGLPKNASLVVVPFLIGGGDHAAVDVASRVRAAAGADGVGGAGCDRVVVLAPLGDLPELYDAIERGVRRAVVPPLLRVGARASALSRRQVEMVRGGEPNALGLAAAHALLSGSTNDAASRNGR